MINQVNYNKSGRLYVSDSIYSLVLPKAIGTRNGLLVQNLSDDYVYIALTEEQYSRNGGFRINAGEIIYFDTVSPKNAIYARAESSSGGLIEYLSNED